MFITKSLIFVTKSLSITVHTREPGVPSAPLSPGAPLRGWRKH